MKKSAVTIIVVFFAHSLLLASNKAILERLDAAVSKRAEYIEKKEKDIAHKKELYSVASGEKQVELCKSIYTAYNGFNTDSAYFYALECERLARKLNDKQLTEEALIYQSQCMSINCLFEHARAILMPMANTLEASNRSIYYKACNSLFVWESEFSTIPEVKTSDREMILINRKRIVSYETDSIWIAQERALIQVDSCPRKSLEILAPILDTLPLESNYIRYLSNSIGSIYGHLGIPDSALHYYAISAINDLELGIMEHASLREVALHLYRQGDIERAYRYMNCCIEDAEFCKARLRTIEMASDMPVILEAYQRTIRHQQSVLSKVIGSLIVALLIIIAVLIYSVASRKRLALARKEAISASEQLQTANQQLHLSLKQLEESNQSLRDSNRIRAAYVTQYMKQCSEAIEKLGTYRKQLLRIAVQSNYQKLLDAIKSTDSIDENLKEFYQHFDETFLSLFPQFVESLNKLLKENERYESAQNGHLSTELRIFALIRLGITDSEDIARFLRLSTKTVYNYRTSVRNRALLDRDKLEEAVAQIGLL